MFIINPLQQHNLLWHDEMVAQFLFFFLLLLLLAWLHRAGKLEYQNKITVDMISVPLS
jgi:hypothetical protein